MLGNRRCRRTCSRSTLKSSPERTLVADLMQGYGASQAPGVRGAADFQVGAQLAVAVRATAKFARRSTPIKLWVRLPR